MMWTPLARLFPSVFPQDHGEDRYGSSAVKSMDPNATPRSRGSWAHLHAHSGIKGSINLSQIHDSQGRSSEDSTGGILPSPLTGETQDLPASGITKVTEYHVSYYNSKSSSR